MVKQKAKSEDYDVHITPAMRISSMTNLIAQSDVSKRFKRIAPLEKGHITYTDTKYDGLIVFDFDISLPKHPPDKFEGNPVERFGSYRLFADYPSVNPLMRPNIGSKPEELKPFYLVDKVFRGEKKTPLRLKMHKDDKFVPGHDGGRTFYVFESKPQRTVVEILDTSFPNKVISQSERATKAIHEALHKITATEGMSAPYLNELKLIGKYFNDETCFRNKPR